MPSGKRTSVIRGKLDLLWIGSLLLVIISLVGLTNILWIRFAPH